MLGKIYDRADDATVYLQRHDHIQADVKKQKGDHGCYIKQFKVVYHGLLSILNELLFVVQFLLDYIVKHYLPFVISCCLH